jgi:hypothetical protein
MQITLSRDNAASSSRAAKPMSATSTSSRSGSQRRACRTIWRAQSISVLWCFRCARQYRSEGARAVRNGSAQVRAAHGIGASSIRLIQRRPEALTK